MTTRNLGPVPIVLSRKTHAKPGDRRDPQQADAASGTGLAFTEARVTGVRERGGIPA